MPLHDCGVDTGRCQRPGRSAALYQQLQLILFVETLNRAWRVGGVIPEPVLIAVGRIDQGTLAKLGLQAIGVQLGLLLAHAGVAPGALGLHHCQGLAVVPPQHVIHKTLAFDVGHALHFKFALYVVALLRVQVPARFLKQQVDIEVTRLRLVVVVDVRCGRVSSFGRSHLGAQLGEFGIQCRRLLLGGDQGRITCS